MERIFFFVFFIISIFNTYAQSSSENYNTKGAEAFSKNDFQAARIWYSEGLKECDLHSIQKLAEIWRSQPSMQGSMQRQMRICFNCLKTRTEAEITEAMPLLRDFYNEGIGTETDSVQAAHWHKEYGKIKGYLPENFPNTTDNPPKAKRRSLISNSFSSFLTYTYSPTMPLGFTAGIYFDKIGGYVSGRTSYVSYNALYECTNLKVPAIGIENPPYEFNRGGWYSRMITGGVLYPLVKNRLFVSAGGGYGKRDYYREIISTTNQNFDTRNKSEWCYNTEASYKGLTLEAGGMFIWKKLVVMCGVNSTQFKDLDVYIGLGINF